MTVNVDYGDVVQTTEGAKGREFRTHITTVHKYLKYVFKDEYIISGNFSAPIPKRETGQMWLW